MGKWKSTALQGSVAVLLIVALTGRVVWDLLQPLVPSLMVVIVLLTIYGFLFRRRG